MTYTLRLLYIAYVTYLLTPLNAFLLNAYTLISIQTFFNTADILFSKQDCFFIHFYLFVLRIKFKNFVEIFHHRFLYSCNLKKGRFFQRYSMLSYLVSPFFSLIIRQLHYLNESNSNMRGGCINI